MRLSTRGIYGLQAALDLAVHFDTGPRNLRDIARAQGISLKYLEQIIAVLKQAGLLESQRGAAGGYVLNRDPAAVTVLEVLNALEGPLEPVPCLSCGGDVPCKRIEDCITRGFWEKLAGELAGVAGTQTLGDLAACCRQEHERAAQNYVI